MDKLEEVKRILGKFRVVIEEQHYDDHDDAQLEAADAICQLFEPKPDDFIPERDIIPVPDTEEERRALGWQKVDKPVGKITEIYVEDWVKTQEDADKIVDAIRSKFSEM